MNLISIQEVEKSIAKYREAEQELAAHFGLKPHKGKRKRMVTQRTVAGRKITAKANGKPDGRSSGKISDKQMKARQLQGKYLGVMRNLTASQKKTVKAVRVEDGVRAAIKTAKAFQVQA